jgi:hypothetical protein
MMQGKKASEISISRRGSRREKQEWKKRNENLHQNKTIRSPSGILHNGGKSRRATEFEREGESVVISE